MTATAFPFQIHRASALVCPSDKSKWGAEKWTILPLNHLLCRARVCTAGSTSTGAALTGGSSGTCSPKLCANIFQWEYLCQTFLSPTWPFLLETILENWKTSPGSWWWWPRWWWPCSWSSCRSVSQVFLNSNWATFYFSEKKLSTSEDFGRLILWPDTCPRKMNSLIDQLIDILRKWIQGVEFHKATVVTTVDTTTAPLSDVYFPSVTICNINQVRAKTFYQLLWVRGRRWEALCFYGASPS